MTPVPQEIIGLIERFDANREAYQSGVYNETQLRREFIDPFFKALGWDVDNEKGYAEAYKDVIHEDSIKVGGLTKAPDYCFRVGGTRKFFIEAKKPSVNLKDDVSPAFQLRRYAWSAKLPLSILTDFEEFVVYDCRVKPVKTDKASFARVLYINHTEYLQRWDEIAQIFSRDAVLKGSFDKYAESGKTKKGTTEVDTAFLCEIESWRDVLARSLAIRNTNLTQKELNFAVQRTIDRIIFLRICEDRGIERYGRLMAMLNGDAVYARLCELFRRADERYNSGLFHFQTEKGRSEQPDVVTPNLDIDDKPLKDIIRNLYYPDSPYEFSVLSADILGQVYEQFLGKVIRLTAGHRAVVEDKPEVKKAGGVYYTPTYIVDYIVKNTVGKLLKLEIQNSKSEIQNPKSKIKDVSPKDVSNIRILDPACGSGSFLLGAYQCLLDWHRDWYVANAPEKWATGKNPVLCQAQGGGWLLTTAERKRILLNNLYGVDVDPQAVEVTKLSLLLKVLEGESEQTIAKQLKLFHERALPDLGNNIKCGNSLIGTDFYTSAMPLLKSNPAQIERVLNGVPANKPAPAAASEQEMEDERYRINPFDWEREFPEIMKSGGFDAVIGNPPYGADLSPSEREYLECYFKLGNTDTAALFMVKQTQLLKEKGWGGLIVPKPFTYSSNWIKIREKLLKSILHITDVSKVWKEVKLEQVIYFYQKDVVTDRYLSSVRRGKEISDVGIINKSLCQKFGFFLSGVSAGEISIAEKMQSQTLFLNDLVINQRGATLQKYITDKPSNFLVLGGKQINRYEITDIAKGFIAKEYIDDEKAFIKHNSILAQNIIAHIQNPTDHIKIIATLSENTKAMVIIDTINQLQNVSSYSSKYLLGILNSKLISWYAYRFIFAKAIRTMHFDSPVTSRIPYPKIDFFNKTDKVHHDNLVALVDQILEHHKQLTLAKTGHDKTVIQRQIDAADRQIDQLVYKLYGLTEEEIKTVEGGSL
ncbi:MAG TPA: DNA methyltransferase [Candidatus Brocadiaceae bacterium]|nr:DNA methyltransferase [Candidatus Brocadiaceae bacterium]